MEDNFRTVDEVATIFNVSTSTVRRWLKNGQIQGRKIGGQWRFDLSTLKQAFLETNQILAEAEKNIVKKDHKPIPLWAKKTLDTWREFLIFHLNRFKPDHVIVNDRRGAKIWELLVDDDNYNFSWGKNLWHSNVLKLLSSNEIKSLFSGKKVFLFDEMMQHGTEMNKNREYLEKVGVILFSLVCIRRREFRENGKAVDYKSIACEDLNDDEFRQSAKFISKLMDIFDPPLDVDHIVIKGVIAKDFTPDSFVQNLSQWGKAFVVRFPDSTYSNYVITLDRPQFFDTTNHIDPNLSISWDAPCKIRFYINLEKKSCYCSFITFPTIQATRKIWEEHYLNLVKGDESIKFFIHDKTSFNTIYNLVYEFLSLNFAIKLFDNFLFSGVANDLGIKFNSKDSEIDGAFLKGLFGKFVGNWIEIRLKTLLEDSSNQVHLFSFENIIPPKTDLHKVEIYTDDSFNTFKCNIALLREIPHKYETGSKNKYRTGNFVSYKEVLGKLPLYTETTIGRIFDFALDWGTIRPGFIEEDINDLTGESVKITRGFCRGEFGVWFEQDSDILTNKDATIQKTFSLGPVALEQFLNTTGKESISATHFHKIFTNLLHDWSPKGMSRDDSSFGSLYLGWMPYKFGPLAIIPEITSYGSYQEYRTILKNLGYITEVSEKNNSKPPFRYYPNKNWISWKEIYRKTTNGFTRSHVSSLMRIYGRLQKEYSSIKKDLSGKLNSPIFSDPLIALATSRNEKTTYICGRFEITDWVKSGNILFPYLSGLSLIGEQQIKIKYILNQYLHNFSLPAKILSDKIFMYQNISVLRNKIIDLQIKEHYDIAEILLETIDSEPKISSDSSFPIKNLMWASILMQLFTSYVRQILTTCQIEIEKSPEISLNKHDASYYFNDLITKYQELKVVENNFKFCIDESLKETHLTEDISKNLSTIFNTVRVLLEDENSFPNPLPEYEKRRERLERTDGFITRLIEISNSEPYYICVADIRNIINLCNIKDIFGLSYEQAILALLGFIRKSVEITVNNYSNIHFKGITNDNIIIVGNQPDDLIKFCIELIRNTTKQLGQIDKTFVVLGLLRMGISLKDSSRGVEFNAIKPGVTALKIGDKKGRSSGEICITEAVYDKLNETNKTIFKPIDDEFSGQGITYSYKHLSF